MDILAELFMAVNSTYGLFFVMLCITLILGMAQVHKMIAMGGKKANLEMAIE